MAAPPQVGCSFIRLAGNQLFRDLNSNSTASSLQAVYRKDYSPTPYYINSIHMDFLLHEDVTRVKSKLCLLPNYNGGKPPALVLDGQSGLPVSRRRDACLFLVVLSYEPKEASVTTKFMWQPCRTFRHKAGVSQAGRQGIEQCRVPAHGGQPHH